MKNLRINMDKYFNQLDDRWRALTVKKQHQYTLYFFLGYLLTTLVIAKVWYETRTSKNDLKIERIENPVLKNTPKLQASTIKKIKIYERK